MSTLQDLQQRLEDIDRLIEEARANAAHITKDSADDMIERDLAKLVVERKALVVEIEKRNGTSMR